MIQMKALLLYSGGNVTASTPADSYARAATAAGVMHA
jgi:hypothetical protein